MTTNTFSIKSNPSLIILGVISGLIILIYSQTVHFDFVYLDDPQLIINNPHLSKGFSKDNIIWAFTSSTDLSNYWIPITWLSFIMDYKLYGLNPGGFHFTNLFFHLLNSILLFTCLYKLSNKIFLAAIVASLFAVHPIHVESVAWVAERKDVLSTFFFLLTILSYYYYVQFSGKLRFLAVILLFLMGILSKPMLVTLPFILLLIDFWPLQRVSLDIPLKAQKLKVLKLFGEKLPFFLIITILSVLTYITQKRGHAIVSFDLYPPLMRLENLFVAYMVYIKKTIWPFDLAIHYPYPGQMSFWLIFISVIIFIFIGVFSIVKIKKFPYIAFGWWWYVITLFPVIGIVIIGPYLIADRYAYISMMGIYVILAWGTEAFTQRFQRAQVPITIISITLIPVLAFLSWHQVKYWKDSEQLFKRAIAVNPDNSIAHNNLAAYYDHNKHYEKAVSHYKEALRISPNYANAYANLGDTFLKMQKNEKSIQSYSKAVKLNPNHAVAYNNLGIAYRNIREFDRSIKAFQNALNIDPHSTNTKVNLGLVLIEKGEEAEGKEILDQVYSKRNHNKILSK